LACLAEDGWAIMAETLDVQLMMIHPDQLAGWRIPLEEASHGFTSD